MNEPASKVKRKYTRRQTAVAPITDKPRLPALDELQAAQESARNAQEGNLKLSRAVDILRAGLELIAHAEMDRSTGLPVGAAELRKLAVGTLDEYSGITGQNWRRVKLTGATRAGDRNLGRYFMTEHVEQSPESPEPQKPQSRCPKCDAEVRVNPDFSAIRCTQCGTIHHVLDLVGERFEHLRKEYAKS